MLCDSLMIAVINTIANYQDGCYFSTVGVDFFVVKYKFILKMLALLEKYVTKVEILT